MPLSHRPGCDRARVGRDRARPPAGAELTRFSQAVRQAMSFLSCLRSRSSESRRAFVAASCFFSAAMCRGGISEACAMDLILARWGPCASVFPRWPSTPRARTTTGRSSMAACDPRWMRPPEAIRVNVRLISAKENSSQHQPLGFRLAVLEEGRLAVAVLFAGTLVKTLFSARSCASPESATGRLLLSPSPMNPEAIRPNTVARAYRAAAAINDVKASRKDALLIRL